MRRSTRGHGHGKDAPGPSILATAIEANAKRTALLERVNGAIGGLEDRVEETIKTLSFSADLPLFAMNQDVSATLPLGGVGPTLDERTAERLRRDYTESQKLNIKNWQPEQIERLRNMVEKYQTGPMDDSLINIIMREWGVTANKASFLARQGNVSFLFQILNEPGKFGGSASVRWSTSHDEEGPGCRTNY